MTITKKTLLAQVDLLNKISKRKYAIYYAYGACQLVLLTDHGGQAAISHFGTKREISGIISAIITYAELDKG